jgi:outer membrane protein assembly factor BamB
MIRGRGLATATALLALQLCACGGERPYTGFDGAIGPPDGTPVPTPDVGGDGATGLPDVLSRDRATPPPDLPLDAGAPDLPVTGPDAGAPDGPGPDLAPVDVAPGTAAVAYQIDEAHTGGITGTGLTPPLTMAWSATLEGQISYPLIAEGKVFVTTSGTGVSYGTRLHALDAGTGQPAWDPIDLSGTYFWSNATYGQGTLYVVNFDGLLRTYNAASGQPGWSVQLPGQYAFSSPPTYYQGTVYVGGAGSGGTLYAVNADNGQVRWSAPVENGDDSSPAVSDLGVFVSYACDQAYGFGLSTGNPLWHHQGPCEGGGGKTAALYQGKLYVRDFEGNLVLDAGLGGQTGMFQSSTIPAFQGGRGFFMTAGTLRGMDLDATTPAWSFAGDGGLTTAPIVVDGYVYVGSDSGTLYAVRADSGQMAWSTPLGVAIGGPDEQNVSSPLTGLAAAPGLLVVPAGSRLFAFH